jgi:BMFP domain-containing protein YqiC
MEKNIEYLEARIKALENELARIKSKNEFLNAKVEMLERAVNEAYLFI